MEFGPVQFGQPIPLFPLPNCVLFPGVVQPLHIFEPRYREMMREVLHGLHGGGGASVIAMGLLKPGWEKTYHACPAINERVCVGRVIAHERLDDGKYNLLLQGLTRANVLSQQKRTGEWGVYRAVMLDPVADLPGAPAHEALQRRVLSQLFAKSALKDLTVTPALASLFEEGVPMSRLIDALAFSLVQDVEAKQRLLEESDVGTRGELLLRELVALAGRLGPVTAGSAKTGRADSAWPPEPGVN